MYKKILLISLLFLSVFYSNTFGAVSLIMNHHQTQAGTQITVPIRVKDFNSIVSIQGTIQFNPAIVTFMSVQDFGLQGMTAGNFGITNISSGKLTFSWFEDALVGKTLADSAVLFSIRFNVIGSVGQQTSLAFVNAPTAIEIINSSIQTELTTLVNGSIQINNTPTTASITLYADSVTAAAGSQVPVSVRAINFRNINSLQGTIEFDPSVVSFHSVNYYGLPGMNSTNFGITQISSGKLTFSWLDGTLSGVDKNNDTPLFTILFSLIGSSGAQSPINIVNSPTAVEITDSLFNILTPTLNYGKVIISSAPSTQLLIKADTTSGANGTQVIVPIRAWDFNQILSMQGTIQFDQNLINYVGVEQFGLPGMDAENFGISQISNGKLMYLWSDATSTGQNLADSTILFAIRFNVNGIIGNYSMIDFINSPTTLECTDVSLFPIATTYQSGKVQITGNSSTITQNPITLNYCSGEALSVNFTTTGPFNSDNIFTFQLSDPSGSFTNSTNLSTIASNISGTFNTTIPLLTPNGLHYRLRVVSSSPASVGTENSSDLIIYQMPNQASTPIGNTLICQDASNTNYTTSATGASSFQWYIYPSTAGTISGSTSTATVDWNSAFSGTAYIKAKGMNNSCFGLMSDSLAVSVTINPLSPSKPNGDTILCFNPANSTYTVSSVANATSYSWTISPSSAGLISGTGTTAIVNWSDNFTGIANIQVNALNGVCAGNLSPIRTVNILSIPSTPAIPSGITTVCKNAPDETFTIQRVANATSYSWNIIPSAAGTISGTDTSAVVNWNNTYIGDAYISVSAKNYNCSSGFSQYLIVSILPIPETPQTPSGITNLCINPNNSIYTIQTVDNATSYTWSLLPLAAGTITTNGTSATINWNDTWTGDATLSVSAHNGICNGTASTPLTISVRAIPTAPSQPSGLTEVCQNSPNSDYTISAVADASSYEWEISPSTAAMLTGNGTTVSVDWNSNFSGSAFIKVRALNSNCVGEWSIVSPINILTIPAQASIPSGNIEFCQNPANTDYTTTNTVGATSYLWMIYPSEAGIISGTTTTTATVDWNETFSGTAYIKVLGTNTICNGNFSDSLAVIINAYPTTPEKPFGDTVLCVNSTNTNYSVSSVANASSYEWSISPINAGTISGTSNTAIVNWDDSFTGNAEIRVLAVNGNCVGNPSPILNISILSIPAIPSVPVGNTTLCQDAADETYIISRIAEATSYTWNITPSSAGTIIGTDTSAIVNWNPLFNGDANISVSAQNQNCSSEFSQNLLVSILPIPETPQMPTGITDLCINPNNTSYSIPRLENTTAYSWTLLPLSAGTIIPSDTSAIIDWADAFTGDASLSVTASNGICTGLCSSALSISVRSIPLAPSQPSGLTEICQDSPNGDYSISAIADASSYEWEISPSTAALLSSNGTTVSVDWNSGFSGNAFLKVRALNSNCVGEWSMDLPIEITPLPSQAIKPFGDSALCINPLNTSYFTHPVLDGETFSWQIIPANAGVVTSTDTSAQIDWNDTWVGTAKLVVTSQNNCGFGISSDTLSIIIRNVPSRLVTPTGTTDVCQSIENSICTLTTVSDANSYEWILNPSSAGTINSINSTEAQINWSNPWSGNAFISVRGINECGSGQWSDSLIIVRYPEVPTPVITQTGSSLNSSATTGNQWYLGGNSMPGETASSLNITQNGDYSVIVTDQYGCTATSATFTVNNVGVLEFSLENKIIVYPNPNEGRFSLEINQSITKSYDLEIFNTLGILVYYQTQIIGNNKTQIQLDLPNGVYYLRISSLSSQFIKLIIQK